ncbi:hypothetical protein [Halobacterium litoreum]|uniref:Uncharacterized protein n=1 Tax=Halobacterium litoreum TaxID=2039234 RepID=A0ABD5NHG5_9EURY|nr:hypothetical protein [Halobacterium litoreum]UHH12424.1 hypothetical protein LT972_09665 [Halobacterium litoreum]
MSRARTSKAAGEAIEAEVIQQVPALRHVGDNTAEWHDARVDGLLEPSDRLPFVGVVVLERDTPVEIKAAQRRLNSGDRGRYFIRQRQHERLVREGASYLFAVYQPRTEHVLAMLVVPASVVDGLLPDGWTSVDGDRAEAGYRQLAWSNLFDPTEVEG